MKKLLLILVAVSFFTIANSQTGFKGLKMVESDTVNAVNEFKLQGETFKLTLPSVNGQIISKSAGIWTNVTGESAALTTITDPAINEATSVAIVDTSLGVLITLTGAGNDQILQQPTVKNSGKEFIVANLASSTNDISVNGYILLPGEQNNWIYDGSEWVGNNINSVLTLNEASTGLRQGGILSGVGGTTFNISDGNGISIDNTTDPSHPKFREVIWTGLTNIPVSFLLTNPRTYVGINGITGAVIQQPVPFSQAQIREDIFLASLGHISNTVIDGVITSPILALDRSLTVSDLSSQIGPVTIGNNIFGNTGFLTINKGSGSTYLEGSNYVNDTKSPNITIDVLNSLVTFVYAYRDGSGGLTLTAPGTLLDPDNWDDGTGVLASLGPNKWTNQRIFYFAAANRYFIAYGQTVYNSFSDARSDVLQEQFSLPANLIMGFAARSLLVIGEGTSTFTDPVSDDANFEFVPFGKFGEISGGGGGGVAVAQTFQEVYNASTPAKIITNGAIGPFQIQSGTGNDADSVLIIRNNAGNPVASINGNGDATVNTLSIENVNVASDDTVLTIDATGVVHKKLSLPSLWTDNITDISPNNNRDIKLWAADSPEILMRDLTYGNAFFKQWANADGGYSIEASTTGGAYVEALEVFSDATVDIKVKLGINNQIPDKELDIIGDMELSGAFYDKDGNPGTSAQVLSSTVTGTDWITPSTGNVSKTGTPVNDQIAVWTGDGIIEGKQNLRYNAGTLTVSAVGDDNGNGTVFHGISQFNTTGTVSTPPAGVGRLWGKTDGTIRYINESGTTYDLTAGQGYTGLHSTLTLDDGTNPHSTTQSDVGLGNVENAAASTLYEPLFSKNTGFNKDFGAIAGTVAQGNDSRFTDARTPLSHKISHQNGGGDEINIGGLSGVAADNQPTDKSLNWTGTFDGQEGTYYLDYGNFTNTPDLSIYWKNDGTSTATGDWDIGANDFTTSGKIKAETTGVKYTDIIPGEVKISNAAATFFTIIDEDDITITNNITNEAVGITHDGIAFEDGSNFIEIKAPTITGLHTQNLQDKSGTIALTSDVPSIVVSIDSLTDASSDATSVFLGAGSGINDDGNNDNTAVGINSLKTNTSGSNNTSLGTSSLESNNTGNDNTAVGTSALFANTSGSNNTAIGEEALALNTIGDNNTAVGRDALRLNQASNNTAVGNEALETNSTGLNNTAVGHFTLRINTIGNNNTAIGTEALESNSSGAANTAVGVFALQSNTIGAFNTAIGTEALESNTIGTNNTAIGVNALRLNSSGASNTAVGFNTLHFATGGNNTVIGKSVFDSLTTGINNIGIGISINAQDKTGSNQLSIGNLIFATGGFGINKTVGIGNVGIKEPNPTEALHINGNVKADNILGYIMFRFTAAATPVILDYATSGYSGTITSTTRSATGRYEFEFNADWTNTNIDNDNVILQMSVNRHSSSPGDVTLIQGWTLDQNSLRINTKDHNNAFTNNGQEFSITMTLIDRSKY